MFICLVHTLKLYPAIKRIGEMEMSNPQGELPFKGYKFLLMQDE